MSDPLVRMPDVRAVHMCSSGARLFCDRHGFDWNEFLKNGIPVSQLEATGDHLALKVAEYVRGK